MGDAGRAAALLLAALLPLAGCAGDGDGDGIGGSGSGRSSYGGDAAGLIGLDPSQVTGMLGPADFRRTDGPAEILQYRGGSCVLDLYLYRDPSTGQYQVKHVEARDRSFASVAPDACISNVARNRRAGQLVPHPFLQAGTVFSS